jgi:hypothetical protein
MPSGAMASVTRSPARALPTVRTNSDTPPSVRTSTMLSWPQYSTPSTMASKVLRRPARHVVEFVGPDGGDHRAGGRGASPATGSASADAFGPAPQRAAVDGARPAASLR